MKSVYDGIKMEGSIMNIVVLGAGALGVYYGKRLEKAGATVTFLVREKRAQQLQEQGLSITSTRGHEACAHVHFTTDVRSISEADLVIVGLKGYHLQDALPQIKQLTEQGAYVLPLLNGIEHMEALQSYVGKDSVLGGLAFIIATLDEKGHVQHTSDFHKLVFGPLMKEQQDFCERFAFLARNANFESIHSSDVFYEQWKKYMYITAFSGITTATNEPIGVLQGNKPTQRTVHALLKEMQQLAGVYGVILPDKEIAETLDNFLTLDPRATSSMHQDRRKGLRLEVDHLQGAAVRLATKKNVHVPVLETIYGMIVPFEYPTHT